MLHAHGGVLPVLPPYVPILGVSAMPTAALPAAAAPPAAGPGTTSPVDRHPSTQVHHDASDSNDADGANSRGGGGHHCCSRRPLQTVDPARQKMRASQLQHASQEVTRAARTKECTAARRESLESGELVCSPVEADARTEARHEEPGHAEEDRFTVLDPSGRHVHMVIDTLEKANAIMSTVVVLPADAAYLPLNPMCYVYGYIKRYVPFVHDVTMCLAAAFMRRVLLKFAPSSRWLDGGSFKSSAPHMPIERTWMAYYVVCIGLAHKTYGVWWPNRHRFMARQVAANLVRCAMNGNELFDMEVTVLETLDYRMTTLGAAEMPLHVSEEPLPPARRAPVV